jgi:hypothetical protein
MVVVVEVEGSSSGAAAGEQAERISTAKSAAHEYLNLATILTSPVSFDGARAPTGSRKRFVEGRNFSNGSKRPSTEQNLTNPTRSQRCVDCSYHLLRSVSWWPVAQDQPMQLPRLLLREETKH